MIENNKRFENQGYLSQVRNFSIHGKHRDFRKEYSEFFASEVFVERFFVLFNLARDGIVNVVRDRSDSFFLESAQFFVTFFRV